MTIVIEKASHRDIESIARINQSLLQHQPPPGMQPAGFLWGDAFSRSDLWAIVDSDEAIVAKDDGRVVGYYLLDNCSETKVLREHEELIRSCQRFGAIKIAARVSKRTQCAVEVEHHLRGLSVMMLRRLRIAVEERYDVLFATVHVRNPKLAAHVRAGWRVVGTFDETHAMILPLASSS